MLWIALCILKNRLERGENCLFKLKEWAELFIFKLEATQKHPDVVHIRMRLDR
ncbi:unnamed protein product [Gemmataceae bacterium]|nr:unnamed protein product [Gemmataceae bacterium]VTU01015.1 unnamed protein product [Gemmataceae bacterium]